MIVLDLSRNFGLGFDLDLAKRAIVELIEQYEGQGDVRIRLVTFSDGSAQPQGTTWLTSGAVQALLPGLGLL